MTNEEILKKAIEKALKKEWTFKNFDFDKDWREIDWLPELNNIIFSHSFAKALWGEEDKWYTTDCTCGGVDFHLGGFDMHHDGCLKIKADRGYKFHLAKMVLEKNPIKYLQKFI